MKWEHGHYNYGGIWNEWGGKQHYYTGGKRKEDNVEEGVEGHEARNREQGRKYGVI